LVGLGPDRRWRISSAGEKEHTSAKEKKMKNLRTLAHSLWDCKYHVVWIPKYRRKELYGKKREVVVKTIRKWADIKGIEIIEGHAVRDHIHLCLAIPPKYSVSAAIGLLKGKSASEVMSFGMRGNRMVRGREFWARGYCVSTVGLDEETIRAYIRNQEEDDRRQQELKL
jgi:putative transposase